MPICPVCGSERESSDSLTFFEGVVCWQDNSIMLAKTPYDIMKQLYEHLGNVVTREAMWTKIYSHRPECDWPEDLKIFDVFMTRIRSVLRIYKIPYTIDTIWGRGWRMHHVNRPTERVPRYVGKGAGSGDRNINRDVKHSSPSARPLQGKGANG